MSTREAGRADAYLPLRPPVLEVLLSLIDGERHGYAILLDIQNRSEGRSTMFPAQLYRYLNRLVDDGLVEESEDRPAPELDDERRRYYRITPLGLQVVRAETKRLEEVVARAKVRLRPEEAK